MILQIHNFYYLLSNNSYYNNYKLEEKWIVKLLRSTKLAY